MTKACDTCGRTDLPLRLDRRCGDCNESACISVDLALVLSIAPEGVSKPRSVIENAIDYLKTMLDEPDDATLVKQIGLRVSRIG